jgi:hypothetical protein
VLLLSAAAAAAADDDDDDFVIRKSSFKIRAANSLLQTLFHHNKKTKINILQCRPVIRKPDIRKSGYKKGTGRVPAELLCYYLEFFGYKKIGYKKVRL